MIFDDKFYLGYAGKPTLLHEKRFTIHWVPDFFCNYTCSYCWPGSNSPYRKNLPVDVLIKGLNDLKLKVNNMGIYDFHLTFAGGEPTIYPEFSRFVQSYCDDNTQKRQSMHITTNLSAGDKWWNNFFKITEKLNYFSIDASWHRESIKDIGLSREKFLRISNKMTKVDRHLIISMVMPPSQFEDIYSDALFFRENQAKVALRAEKIKHKGVYINHPEYTKDMLDRMIEWNMGEQISPFIHVEGDSITKYDDVEQAITMNKNDYRGWLCYAGTTGVRIRPNGDITRGFICIDKKIGNITDDSYTLNIDPKPCITTACSCSGDMNKPKIKVKY